ncbi:MAG: adenosylcobalamin-dependent ribonucleoside-diphosphate reductase [Candidatus Colwellbacteria bacterium]|nr:adenosylcobalamin-dependent ribonucleoside-diphosphate reductase [Candidatus Colwellbacteria bacterium]
MAKKYPTKPTLTAKDKEINSTFSENSLKMLKKRYLYTFEDGHQETPAEMFRRVAKDLAAVEKEKYKKNASFVKKVESDFFDVLAHKEFTPAGRTMTNAGTPQPIVANCIVLPIADSLDSIFQTLKDAVLLQQMGSGLGFAYDTLRPAMLVTKRTRGSSSGPVSFLQIYDKAFGIIKQQGRHGANMAMMSVNHPDVLDFITCKKVEGDIRNFNISVKVTDEFMRAVSEGSKKPWLCEWKGKKMKPRRVLRRPNGAVYGVEELDMTASQILDEIVDYAWLNGEPGIVFIDEVNRTNPLPQMGSIQCSNPCGEQFLHPYDNCNLGSINLAPFAKNGAVDWKRLKFVTQVATRMLDNVIDRFNFPVEAVTELARKNRRIGLGIMGFADMLYQLGIAYNSKEGIAMAEKTMKFINDTAHEYSAKLAKEKSAFPNWKGSIYGKRKIKIRNAALTTVAPTGSISMMLDTSSGIEPNFALAFIKQDKDGLQYPYLNKYFDAELHKRKFSEARIKEIRDEVIKTGTVQHMKDLPQNLRDTFVVAMDISGEEHMKAQAAFQKHVDNSISKTINLPNSATKEDVKAGYVTAWKLKCKSSTVYRDGSRNVQILNIGTSDKVVSTIEDPLKRKAPMNLEVDKGKIAPRVRPEVMQGRTYKIKTGYGNLFVTINNDEAGAPFEVFAAIGKSGGFFQEQSEAICRLISLALRSGIKTEEIIDMLKGIRGPMPVMSDKGTIFSLPDAIARVLEEHAMGFGVSSGAQEALPVPQTVLESAAKNEVISPKAQKREMADFGHMPGCPDCGQSLVMAEGCISCKSCGFTRCL